MIVATAGHIDHGKTALVKALTGVDTDRLPEEKARGISIDLGFAYLPLEGGGLIGFVDVPGHERFIRNMLAGVCGIDFALLVVAADDGVMPQTVEHLAILDLLGIRRGLAVVTKTDRVSAERTAEVAREVAALLEGTGLAGSAVVGASALTGAGLAEVRERLLEAARAHRRRRSAGEHFRLAIDRAFSVAGSGTVVTGTVFSGETAVGERLVVSPAGVPVRVRAIQIRGESVERASAGFRCALNLAGAELENVARGNWVLAEPIHAPTQRLAARVTVLRAEAQPLRHWTPLHLHLGTADVTARIALRGGQAIAPGASATAHLVLDKPIGALHGDRFILRDQSARRTLGGGVVLDPFAPPARRLASERLAELEALAAPGAEEAFPALLAASPRGVDLGRFERMFNLTGERARAIYEAAGVAVLGRERRIAIARAEHARLREATLAALREFHRSQPQALGMELEALRAAAAPRLEPDAFQALLRELADERALEVGGSRARLPGHDATSNPADEKLWREVLPLLEAGGPAPPTVAELAAKLGTKEAALKDFLHRKSRSRELFRVTAERFYPRSTLAALAATAAALAKNSPGGAFTAAQYRDALGIGRTLAIEILEALDGLGITQRIGDARKMRRDFVPVLGAAAPIRAQPARPPSPPGSPKAPAGAPRRPAGGPARR
jgi:selenocysteine-specific elongation factor